MAWEPLINIRGPVGPAGPQGPQGIPGADAMPQVEAVTDWVNNPSILQDALDARYATAPDGAYSRGRLVFIFDDGLAGHYSIGLPLFERFGGRCSLAIVSDQIDGAGGRTTAAQIEDAYRRGHGIIAHSKLHVDMTSLTAAARQAEWDEPLRKLKGLTGAPALDWVYPQSARNETTDAEGYLRFRRMFTGMLSDYSIPTSQRMPHVVGRFAYTAASHAEFMGLVQAAHDNSETLIAYTHSITDAGIEAGITEALQLASRLGMAIVSVDALDDPNLVVNAGFEDDLTGWTIGSNGVAGTHTAASVTGGAPTGFNGEYVLALTSDTAGHNVWVESERIRVRGAGFVNTPESVTASAHVRNSTPAPPAGYGANIAIAQFDDTGAETLVTATYSSATAFARVSHTETLLPETVEVTVRVRMVGTTGSVVADHVHLAPTAEGILG